MNEVASALAFTDAAIAMVPSGSGNGLARELKIPFDPAAAFDVAYRGREMVIDAGEIGGRLFFNIAGIGLDARVAHRFAVDGLGRRGFSRYLALTIGELRGYLPDQLTVTTPSSSITKPVLLVAIANGRQYRQRRDHRARRAARRRAAGRRDRRPSVLVARVPRAASDLHGAARDMLGE